MPRGGPRPGAGRPKGSPSARTEAVRQLFERLSTERPNYHPVLALIDLADKAEAEGNLPLARDCHSAAAPFIVPRPRPVEIDPDGAVDLERRITEARKGAGANDIDLTLEVRYVPPDPAAAPPAVPPPRPEPAQIEPPTPPPRPRAQRYAPRPDPPDAPSAPQTYDTAYTSYYRGD